MYIGSIVVNSLFFVIEFAMLGAFLYITYKIIKADGLHDKKALAFAVMLIQKQLVTIAFKIYLDVRLI